jgi:hypothetical protein
MELRRSVRRRVFGNCAFGGFWGVPFEGRPVPSFEIGRSFPVSRKEAEHVGNGNAHVKHGFAVAFQRTLEGACVQQVDGMIYRFLPLLCKFAVPFPVIVNGLLGGPGEPTCERRRISQRKCRQISDRQRNATRETTRHSHNLWIVEAHRDDGKRFVVRADDKLTAFLELARIICAHLLTKDCEHR